MVEQFDIIKVKLEGIGEFGDAASEYQGLRVSVFGGIPGETVEARVIRISHDGLDAIVENVIEASPHRRSAVCNKFGECSGCQWQHIRYSHQLELKQEQVRRALESEGLDSASVQPVLASPDEFGYRNHARLTVRRRINQFGFINRVTHRFVPIDQCPIMAEGIDSLMAALSGRCAETTQFSIRYGVNTDDYLIQPRMLNPEITVITGQPYYFDVMGGRKFRVSSPAFFQVNTPQAERLADLIRARLELSGSETIIDAYAGVGTFAALLAPYVKKVIAIEESGAAVKDARVNVRDIPNIELLEAKTESVLPHLGRLADAVIIDPSRTGCHPAALKTLSFYPPKRLVYVSCNPEALARDLRVLTRGPYAVKDISPVDLFPQTYHVETVATLTFAENKEKNFLARQKLVLASASPRRSEVLTAMGLKFEAAASEIAEALTEGLSPEEQAKAHAINKAAAVAERYGAGTIIAADTIVVSGDEILGKPASAEEATAMLRKLRGKTHRVVSGVAVTDAATGETIADSSTTLVTMRHYTDQELEHYVKTGSPLDKAGAYGIQDKGFNPVSHIKGCYLNVVGLPVCLMQGLLLKLGVHPTISTNWRPDGNCPDCRKWQCA
ncbi:Maf family nucleotide pyrophosphatase [Dehalogenimonas alkenigignens]|uniref:dTTP/UTP pyrophosphatase n=1 Tax=Dehalogenimonas alkenigignens TaxID=1217799 RepID=A0A0W0GIS7_9CHLR|nr:Maf family nucleotide pyrophosphatase [Dehalogenimonas alkenigignens]KTB48424.1 Maf protein [Dehalogenimonas alkenigignens]PVV85121.1 septum formation protein Maf [Dehalogenimonas alkenigignens]